MSKKILIVDDDEDLLEIMVERMRMRGMTVVSAKTAIEAFTLIEQETFDVMIIDFMLPEIDGLQAIKMIREKQPGMRIILQTAYATIEKESEALALGAWDVVEKPADEIGILCLGGSNGEGRPVAMETAVCTGVELRLQGGDPGQRGNGGDCGGVWVSVS